jgi:hypothetical protein
MGPDAMNDTTAVVLSISDCCQPPPGVDVLVHLSKITNSAEQQAARFDAVMKVETPWFFFLDDDDELPTNFPGVLDLCKAADVALAYTDETIVHHDDGARTVRRSRAYSQSEHLADPMLVHHLVVMRTSAAQAAVKRLPRGHYCPEFMLFWEVAKSGATYIPAVGYIWHKRPDGMHNQPWVSIGQMRSRLWAKDNP